MPPKDKKKKKAKPQACLTDEPRLQPFGVQAGQLVHNTLGCTATVLGVKVGAGGTELWVKYAAGGLEAPLDTAGWAPCSATQQLRQDIEQRQREQRAIDDKWRVYNEAQAAKAAEAAKAASKKKTTAPAAAVGQSGRATPAEARLASRGATATAGEAPTASARSAAV